jgi:hypothetical protein
VFSPVVNTLSNGCGEILADVEQCMVVDLCRVIHIQAEFSDMKQVVLAAFHGGVVQRNVCSGYLTRAGCVLWSHDEAFMLL